MIIYIHGFGSNGEGSKAKILRELLEDEGFIAPSLSYIPELAINTLKELIESYSKYEKVYLMGSSLGGYYAIYLADLYNIKAVLINPSVSPTRTLQKVLGEQESYYDGSKFEWNKKHLKMLEQYEINKPQVQNYLLLSQKGDETLNYIDAMQKLYGCKKCIEEGGSHSFDGIGRYIADIEDFFEE